MIKGTSQVVNDAMALPPKSKARLAERLLASLDDTHQKEIDAFDAGKVHAIPAALALRTKRRRKA
jgi:hypothetical protein